MEGSEGVKEEFSPPGRRGRTSERRGEYPRWNPAAEEANGEGLAHAEALRLETAYLRWDICCQLL